MVAEDVAGKIGRTIVAGGEIIVEVTIPSCLPINLNTIGNVVTHLCMVVFSKLRLIIEVPLIAFVTIYDVINTILASESINCLVSDRFTTANILLINFYKCLLIVLIDELKHII